MEEKKAYPISLMCAVLEVRSSGDYAWLKKRGQPRNSKRLRLLKRVEEVHEETRQSYGSRRMSQQLKAEGYQVGRFQARSLMREAQVKVKKNRRFIQTTDSRHGYPIAPHLLERQFNPAQANQVWAGDITYLWTQAGWAYLAVVIDLFSRRVVGWSVKSQMKTELVEEALKKAVERRKPSKGVLFHSDRGSQYASSDYRQCLRLYGMRASMSRQGECHDNSPVERFFGSLKKEWTNSQVYHNLQQVRLDVMRYIEMFYNSKRLHSTLGYLSPIKFENVTLAA